MDFDFVVFSDDGILVDLFGLLLIRLGRILVWDPQKILLDAMVCNDSITSLCFGFRKIGLYSWVIVLSILTFTTGDRNFSGKIRNFEFRTYFCK